MNYITIWELGMGQRGWEGKGANGGRHRDQKREDGD